MGAKLTCFLDPLSTSVGEMCRAVPMPPPKAPTQGMQKFKIIIWKSNNNNNNLLHEFLRHFLSSFALCLSFLSHTVDDLAELFFYVWFVNGGT